jgi:hypothetical protein
MFFFEHGAASTFFGKYPTLLRTSMELGAVFRKTGSEDSTFFSCAGSVLALIFRPSLE